MSHHGPAYCDVQQISVPAYFRPGPVWDEAGLGFPGLRYLIMNPSSGSGTRRDLGYAWAVQVAQAAHVKVLGYVDTDRMRRSLDLAYAEIEKYRRWYGVDGIFVDRAGTTPDQHPYYEQLARHIRATPGLTVAMNPGVYPAEIYAQSADVIVTFEGNLEMYRSLTLPSWIERYPAQLFWHLVHDVPRGQLSSALGLARDRRAGNVYITDRRMDNPWDQLPSYWQEEIRLVLEAPAP